MTDVKIAAKARMIGMSMSDDCALHRAHRIDMKIAHCAIKSVLRGGNQFREHRQLTPLVSKSVIEITYSVLLSLGPLKSPGRASAPRHVSQDFESSIRKPVLKQRFEQAVDNLFRPPGMDATTCGSERDL